MKLTLPMPPNRANSRWHWRTENKKMKDYWLRCDMKCMESEGGYPLEPIREATIRVTLYTWSPMDTDNLMARLKWPVDWLVDRNFITDDSPDVLKWELPKQEVDRKNQRIEIELEAVA